MAKVSIGKAWDEAKFALARDKRLIVPVVLGFVLLPVTLLGLFNPAGAAADSIQAAENAPGWWFLLVFVAAMIMIAGQLAIILLVNGWSGNLGEALGRGARRSLTLIGSTLLIALPLAIILIVLMALLGVATGDDGQIVAGSLSPAGSVAILALVAVFLFVSVRMAPLAPVVAMHNLGPVASLRRAFEISKGNFWRLLAFIMLLVLGFLVLAMAVGAVIGALAAMLFGRPEPGNMAMLLIALASGVLQAGFVAVYCAMLARIVAQVDTADAPAA